MVGCESHFDEERRRFARSLAANDEVAFVGGAAGGLMTASVETPTRRGGCIRIGKAPRARPVLRRICASLHIRRCNVASGKTLRRRGRMSDF